MNPIKRLGLWLAGETKSRNTAEVLPRSQIGRPYQPRYAISTETASNAAYKSAGIVYACIRLLTDTATSAPLHVYQRDGEDWTHVPQHPLQQLLDTPNARLTRRRVYARAIQHLMLSGNAIWFKVRVPKSGPPTQLWPINPDQVKPVPDERDFISHYELLIDGRRVRIDARDVVHLQLENPDSPWWGMGPLQAAMQDVQLYKGNKAWNLRTVERGAVTPGVLEIPEDIGAEQYQKIREQLDERSFGHEDAGRELILGSGMKYTRMSLTGEELGYLESMRFGREEISMIFGVPAPLLTPENATLANVDAYDKQFWQNTIVPLNTSVADILTHNLVPDFGTRGDLVIQHDYSAVPAMQDGLGDLSRVAERFIRAGFTAEGVNRLLDLGFEDGEIKPPVQLANPFPGEQEQLAGHGPARRKAEPSIDLEAFWRAVDQERQAWEVEVATRLNAILEAERDQVIEAFRTSSEDAATVVKRNRAAWIALLHATYLEAGRHFARREYDRLSPKARKAFDSLAIAADWAQALAAHKVVGISETTITALTQIISAGLTPDADGYRRTIDQIAADLGDTYDTWLFTGPDATRHLTIDERAMMIARTELGTAMNYGHQEGARQAATEYDLVLDKGWSSSFDDRVRESHLDVHGEIVPMDGTFSNGLQHPGDPDGPAEEVINCRCVVFHQVRR